MTPAAPRIPPLVEPGPPLSRAELDRYSRHVLLPDVGAVGQRRLRAARVAVIGAGGLGSPILTYLTAAGVGTIGVVDFDVVEESNLQRQTVHGVEDVGRAKVESAVAAVRRIDPTVDIRAIPVRLTADNALSVLSGYDLVLDGTDNFATRYLVNDVCVLLGIPCVWGSVFRFEGQVSVFWAARGPQYRDLFPTPPPPGSVPSCGEGGVLGVVCAVVGSLMATEAVKLICGVGEPLLGRVLTYDALRAGFRTLTVRPDPAAVPVTGLVDYDQWCGSPAAGPEAVEAAELSAAELDILRSGSEVITVVDVREPSEHHLGLIPGSLGIPLARVTDEDSLAVLRAAADSGRIVVYCASGVRSARAVVALTDRGVPAAGLTGGFTAWTRSGGAVVGPDAVATRA
ncbi:molybdopterin-synthase adenylyltransferase MoeB [Nakamurella deserti]|uniref:molybdopterin-synthase adenylyltransferase MoeB n=1 Tax=Nakamurella deserti TaxID=2164074 RepID=UPI000DBE1017|nr:molybdopterin-synthase adenylyltransferase MoeB [Nakamurella deserti]